MADPSDKRGQYFMAEEIQESLPDSQGTPPAEGSESASQETTVDSQDQATQPETTEQGEEQPAHSRESQDGNPEDQSEQQGAKPTREQRRIHSLLTKLKESQGTSATPPPGTEQQYITKEEREEGSVDPDALEKRLRQAVRQEIQQERISQEYSSAVKDHQADLEGVKELDPNVEALAVQQYEAINYQLNPFTGKKEFIPAVKMSEIVTKIQDNIQKAAEKLAENMTTRDKEYVQEVSENQAIPTTSRISSSKKVTPETTNFKDFEKAYSS